jgi:hypothetical protein
VVDAGHFAWGSTKDLWLPSIKMRVEVYHRDWAVSAVDRSEKRQSDCVITSEGDNPGKSLSILRWTFFFGVGRWSAGQDRVVSLFDLVKSPSVVVSAR